jgi:hypothetical protein
MVDSEEVHLAASVGKREKVDGVKNEALVF